MGYSGSPLPGLYSYPHPRQNASPVPTFMNFSAARSLSASSFFCARSDSGFCNRQPIFQTSFQTICPEQWCALSMQAAWMCAREGGRCSKCNVIERHARSEINNRPSVWMTLPQALLPGSLPGSPQFLSSLPHTQSAACPWRMAACPSSAHTVCPS